MIVWRFCFLFLGCIIYSELRNILNFLNLIKSLISFHSLYKIFFFIFNKNINPYKSKELDNLIKINKKYWEKKNKKFDTSKILVECFLNQQLYNTSNIIICKYLEKILNINSIAIIRKFDFKSEVILRSFGIDNIYKYSFNGIFNRVKFIYLSAKIVSKLKNTKDLYNLKINEIDIGLTTYDTWIRYSKIPSSEKININMVYILANALYAKNFYEKIIFKENIKHHIQAEKQFVPLNIFFQVALKNKIKVYARDGFSHLTTRIYSNFEERNYTKIKFSKKALQKILSSLGNRIIEKHIDKYYNFLKKNDLYGKSWVNAVQNKSQLKEWKNKIDGNERHNNSRFKLSLIDLKNYDKNLIRRKFGWDKEKKIITIFFPYLIDGIYQNGRRNLYIDNFKWIVNTLKIIKKIKKFNWIIREHPQEIRYNTKTNLSSILDEYTKKYTHIKRSPLDINPRSIINFTDIAVTCNGTVALEYQSFGKKVFIAENAYYNHFGFKEIPKNIKNYIQSLKNLQKIKKPKKSDIIKAKTFLFTQLILSKIPCCLLPESKPNFESRMNRNDEDIFWKIFSKNLNKTNNIKKDPFFKMLKIQIKNDTQHTYNYKNFFSKNIKISDLIKF